MKKVLLLSISFFLLSLSLSAFSFQGFIITLDGKRISGKIEQVNTIKEYIDVIFVNDFGTTYNIHPALIRGFIYKKNGDTHIFESAYQNKKWLFLRLIYRGDELSLFKMPEIQVNWRIERGNLVSHSPNSKRFWIQNGKKSIFKLKRRNYRRKIARMLKKKAPALAEKIGQKGYRYNDLPQIFKEYDEIINSNVRKL